MFLSQCLRRFSFQTSNLALWPFAVCLSPVVLLSKECRRKPNLREALRVGNSFYYMPLNISTQIHCSAQLGASNYKLVHLPSNPNLPPIPNLNWRSFCLLISLSLSASCPISEEARPSLWSFHLLNSRLGEADYASNIFLTSWARMPSRLPTWGYGSSLHNFFVPRWVSFQSCPFDHISSWCAFSLLSDSFLNLASVIPTHNKSFCFCVAFLLFKFCPKVQPPFTRMMWKSYLHS